MLDARKDSTGNCILAVYIVGIGDSTTAGTPGFLSPIEAPPRGRGNPESQYAYWMMKAHPDWIVLNRGVNGQGTDEILARFDRDVIQEAPDYVIILAGVNDIFQGLSLEAIKPNLLEMYRKAIDNGIIPVAATVLPYNTAAPAESRAIRDLNVWIAETAKELTILFSDTNHAVADPSNPDRLHTSPEGNHPDVSGYRAMGEALTRTIESHLANTKNT
jgi:lysophospholipase L1-like esterase